MTESEKFITDVERQIDIRNADIAKFRIIAEVADPDEQIEFYQIIEDIVEKEKEVKKKLAAYDETDEAGRNYLRKEIGFLQKRVEDAIEAARYRIN